MGEGTNQILMRKGDKSDVNEGGAKSDVNDRGS